MEKKDWLWFEVRIGGSSKTCSTFEEAQDCIKEMAAGYPSNLTMREEDREYWRKVGPEARIFEVRQLERMVGEGKYCSACGLRKAMHSTQDITSALVCGNRRCESFKK